MYPLVANLTLQSYGVFLSVQTDRQSQQGQQICLCADLATKVSTPIAPSTTVDPLQIIQRVGYLQLSNQLFELLVCGIRTHTAGARRVLQ